MSANSWPGGKRHAMTPDQHEAWNARNYPGTRQLCCLCDQPTGFCEEDGYRDDDVDTYCEECWEGQA